MSARKAATGDGPYPLPEGWRWVTLGEVAEIVRTGVKPEDMSGDEPYLGLDCIAAGGAIERWTTTGAEKVASNKFAFSEEHVLMGKLRPYLGKISLPENGGLCSTDIIPILPGEDLDRRFLGHWLRTDAMVEEANKVATGASLPRISPKAIERLDIPLPPLAEQRRVAEILDSVSRINEKHNQREGVLGSLVTSSFLNVFGNPSFWEKGRELKTIGELAQSVTYGSSSKSGIEGGLPILRMGNITDSGLIDMADMKYLNIPEGEIGKYTVRPGDMLFNRTNSVEKVGKAAVVKTDSPLAYAGYLVRVRFEDVRVADFVSAYLRSSHGKATRRKLAKAAVNQANISAKELKSIPVLVPDDGQLQEFSDLLKQVEERRKNYCLFSQHLVRLASSLQSRAFRGEL